MYKYNKRMNSSYPPTEQRNIEINQNIYKRNIPDSPIDPIYSITSTFTRGTVFPISTLNKRQMSQLPLSSVSTPPPTPETSFMPYQNHPNPIGYLANISKENSLRNQYFAIQNGPMPIYVPSSTSDLYQWSPAYLNPLPPSEPIPSTEIPNHLKNNNIGNMLFLNPTKNQSRTISTPLQNKI